MSAVNADQVDLDVLTLARLARMLERACGDLTLPQYRVLAFIVRGEERASNLADQLALTRPTVSATIDTLVERGLLERTGIDGDRRAVRLTTTPAGSDALLEAQQAMRGRLDNLLAHTDDPDAVRSALEQLTGALTAAQAANKAARAAASASPEATTPEAARA